PSKSRRLCISLRALGTRRENASSETNVSSDAVVPRGRTGYAPPDADERPADARPPPRRRGLLYTYSGVSYLSIPPRPKRERKGRNCRSREQGCPQPLRIVRPPRAPPCPGEQAGPAAAGDAAPLHPGRAAAARTGPARRQRPGR